MSPRFSEYLPEGVIPDVDVADLVDVSVIVFDLDMHVMACNAEAERLYGWNREEIVGKPLKVAFQDSAESFAVMLNKIRETGTWKGESVRTTKSGNSITVEAKWSLRRDANGALLDVVETSRGIEARRTEAALEKSERRYREFFHFLPVALFHLDRRNLGAVLAEPRSQGVTDLLGYFNDHPDFAEKAMDALKIVEVNQHTVEMLRGKSPEDFKGSVARNWTESPEVFHECLAAAYRGQKCFDAQIKIKALDGTVLDALFFAAFSPVTGEQNVTLLGMIDISDRVKAQMMLAQLQAEIAHAARVSVLGELTASIAHEVSQPLTAIEANTEASLLWLARSPPNIDEVRELSARTAAEVQRAADIIHRIRSMVIRASPEQKSVDLNRLIEEAMLFLRHELQRNEIEASLRLGQSLPHILGDRVQLQQVIVNLAVNAVQAMASVENSQRQLTIETAATSDDHVLMKVSDTGPGIANDVLQRLFESFFTTKATGMGIGLPVCLSIIEAHGGRISAGNREDRPGARFTIHLPIAPSL